MATDRFPCSKTPTPKIFLPGRFAISQVSDGAQLRAAPLPACRRASEEKGGKRKKGSGPEGPLPSCHAVTTVRPPAAETTSKPMRRRLESAPHQGLVRPSQ